LFGTYQAGFLALVVTSSLCASVLFKLKSTPRFSSPA
jgi:hypothetical protein